MHRLSELDTESRTATCAICGPARIVKAGRGQWACTTPRKEWDAANAERRREIRRDHERRNPRSARDRSLRHHYGITLEQYEEMHRQQGGLCAICKKVESRIHANGKVRPLAVDHCHDSGQVRGLLCDNCNRGIGMLMHDREILRAATEYLKEN